MYWQFYGYSKPTALGGGGLPRVAHEGDWERVIVDLTSFKVPSKVGFVAHHMAVDYVPYQGAYSRPPQASSNVLTYVGLAPVGYVTRLGHGTWPDAGRDYVGKVFGYDYRANGGAVWHGRQGLRSVSSQAWFGSGGDHGKCRSGAPMPADRLECGFGGAWGHAGNLADTTGPLGPSAYKHAATN